jgi:surface protein
MDSKISVVLSSLMLTTVLNGQVLSLDSVETTNTRATVDSTYAQELKNKIFSALYYGNNGDISIYLPASVRIENDVLLCPVNICENDMDKMNAFIKENERFKSLIDDRVDEYVSANKDTPLGNDYMANISNVNDAGETVKYIPVSYYILNGLFIYNLYLNGLLQQADGSYSQEYLDSFQTFWKVRNSKEALYNYWVDNNKEAYSEILSKMFTDSPVIEAGFSEINDQSLKKLEKELIALGLDRYFIEETPYRKFDSIEVVPNGPSKIIYKYDDSFESRLEKYFVNSSNYPVRMSAQNENFDGNNSLYCHIDDCRWDYNSIPAWKTNVKNAQMFLNKKIERAVYLYNKYRNNILEKNPYTGDYYEQDKIILEDFWYLVAKNDYMKQILKVYSDENLISDIRYAIGELTRQNNSTPMYNILRAIGLDIESITYTKTDGGYFTIFTTAEGVSTQIRSSYSSGETTVDRAEILIGFKYLYDAFLVTVDPSYYANRVSDKLEINDSSMKDLGEKLAELGLYNYFIDGNKYKLFNSIEHIGDGFVKVYYDIKDAIDIEKTVDTGYTLRCYSALNESSITNGGNTYTKRRFYKSQVDYFDDIDEYLSINYKSKEDYDKDNQKSAEEIALDASLGYVSSLASAAGALEGTTAKVAAVVGGVVTAIQTSKQLYKDIMAYNKDVSPFNELSIEGKETILELVTSGVSTDLDKLSNTCISGLTDLSGLFKYTPISANSLKVNLSTWDTSSVINMSTVFKDKNIDIGNLTLWDTSHVISMVDMFNGAKSKSDINISIWNTKNVANMDGMFANSNINEYINNWDISSLISTENMFYKNTAFNQDLSRWDMSKIISTAGMFQESVFNQDISDWNLSNLLVANKMFALNKDFNQDISSWNLSKLISADRMFEGASRLLASTVVPAHNSDYLSGWKLDSIQSMDYMFDKISSDLFTVDLSSWNVKGCYPNNNNIMEKLNTNMFVGDELKKELKKSNRWPNFVTDHCPSNMSTAFSVESDSDYVESSDENTTYIKKYLNKGWNLISNPSKKVMQNAYIPKYHNGIFTFENSEWKNDFDSISPCKGFWIKEEYDNTRYFSYLSNEEKCNLEEESIESGWSLLGTSETLSYPKENLGANVIWSFVNGEWIKNPESISPASGFWINK